MHRDFDEAATMRTRSGPPCSAKFAAPSYLRSGLVHATSNTSRPAAVARRAVNYNIAAP